MFIEVKGRLTTLDALGRKVDARVTMILNSDGTVTITTQNRYLHCKTFTNLIFKNFKEVVLSSLSLLHITFSKFIFIPLWYIIFYI